MKIKDVINALENFAPLPLQESWDNAGLQTGLTEAEVSGALLCLDVTEAIVDEAISHGFNLVVSHHPLLFRGLKRLTGDTMVERALIKAVRNDVCIVSLHTNMDNAPGGVNFRIASHLGLLQPRFFATRQVGNIACGSGVIGILPSPMQAADFIALVKARFHAGRICCNELLRHPVCKVAVCGGAGDFLLDAAISEGADAFLTGEAHYHQYFGHEQDIQMCVIGHYESEQFTAEIFRDIIHEKCPGVDCRIAETNTNPIHYF